MNADPAPSRPEAPPGVAGPDGPLLRLIRDRRVAFVVVGAVNTGVGFVWFILFSLLFRLWWPGVSGAVFGVILCAQIASSLSAFVFYRTVVFRVRGHLLLDFGRFQLVYVVPFLLNLLVVPPLTIWLGWHEIVAQLVFTIVFAVFSWFGHSRFSFRRSPEESS